MPQSTVAPAARNLPYRLLAPGPVPVPTEVLKAMSGRVLHHRTPEFIEILKGAWSGLSEVFATRQPVQIVTGTGSSGMEAAVVNTLSPGEEAVVVVSGKFGERWAEMCEAFGMKTHRLDVPWGEPVDTDQFATTLRKFPAAAVVFSQACETSTGTLQPIREMATLVRKILPNALFAVDAITAVGCLPLPMDEWGLDVVVGGSQKAFMIPAGLSFIALSEKAWIKQASVSSRKFYFDLAAERKANLKGDSQFSIPTPLILGLGMVLDRIRSVGINHLFQRTALLSDVTRFAGGRLGLEVFSTSPSPSVTALKTPVDSAALRDRLERDFAITVMGGQDHLKGKILRVGHMGDVRDEDMTELFRALAELLAKQNIFISMRSELEARLRTQAPLFR